MRVYGIRECRACGPLGYDGVYSMRRKCRAPGTVGYE